LKKPDSKYSFPAKDLFGVFTGFYRNVYSLAETSVRYVQKAIQNKLKDLVAVVIFLVLGLFFLMAALMTFLFAGYQILIRYVNSDPLIAAAILGTFLLLLSAIFFILLSRKLNK